MKRDKALAEEKVIISEHNATIVKMKSDFGEIFSKTEIEIRRLETLMSMQLEEQITVIRTRELEISTLRQETKSLTQKITVLAEQNQ